MSDIDLDALATKMMARFKRPPADDDDGDEGSSGKVPVERLRREIARRKELEAKIGEVEAEVSAFRAAHDKALAAIKAQTADELKGIAGRHAEDLGLVEAGIRDPMGRRAVRDAWEAAPKEARGESASKWWTSTLAARDAHLADPEKVAAPEIPRVLVGYLPEPVQAQTQTKQAKPPPTAGKQPVKGAADPFAGLKPDASVDELMAALRGGP